MNEPMKDIDKLLKVSEKEAEQVMQEAARRRARNVKATGASESMTNRSLSMIPDTVYWGLTLKYGKGIWSDKKFLKEFWDTYAAFRTCEKY